MLLVGSLVYGPDDVEAIQGGVAGPEMAPSVVRVTYNHYEVCTGSVVGDGWILTAYHCLEGVDNWRWLRVQIWRNGTVDSGQAYRSDLAAAPLYRPGSTGPSGQNSGYSDVLLLRTATAMPDWVKTIPLALSWPEIGTRLTQYGYGRTSASGRVARTLQKTPDGDLRRVSCSAVAPRFVWRAGHICARGSTSAAWPGDSGGPLLWWVHGHWQQIGDFSAYPPGSAATHWQSYWSEADNATRSWIASQVTGAISANTILRDPASGASWLYKSDGYRHWIPNGTIYNCLTAAGTPVNGSWTLRHIETIPDYGGSSGWATCTSPPPPPQTWPEQETPNHPVNTFLNYHNASGLGPAISAGQWVNVSCRVYDPTIVSSNPDGWWYRIQSAPWNGQYYSPANTFMNGDPYGGPYTHNTDFNVAVC